ncbi:MAG: putative negative regulator of RcsB-dependent stress response [Candidatus Latescibacterota bacterium]|jgi:predicted negative regulator of RcsB-dependent stress response
MPDEHLLHDIAADGRKAIGQTTRILTYIGQSTEAACGELFAALQLLLADEKLPQAAKGQLQNIMNTLQFQDMVSQQLAAVQTLLATFDNTLAPLADVPDEADLVVDIEGAFDATANFDRERVDVHDLDAWVKDAKEKKKAE